MNIKPATSEIYGIKTNEKAVIRSREESSPPVPGDKVVINPNEKQDDSLLAVNPMQFKKKPAAAEAAVEMKESIKPDEGSKPDTFVFVLNSSGETNCCKPLIAAVKNKGYKVKVIHFRQNSKEILTSQGILEDEDFVDGTNALYLPRVKSIFKNEIDPAKVVKLVGTPHHAYCRFAFSRAKKEGIPTVAMIDMGTPGTAFGYRHTFYKALTFADSIVVPNDAIRKQLEGRCKEVKDKSGFQVDTSKIVQGGNPGFEAFRQLVELNRSKADEIRNEMGIGKDDIVVSFSSQPTPNNGKVLEIMGKSLNQLSKKYPGKKIHALMCPHPRDLYSVGMKNLFGTESSISISQKTDILKNQVTGNPDVVIHEMPKYSMEKASAISNIVMTESSTTAYECAHSDIPSIFVRTPQQGSGGAFPGFNRVPTAKTPENLAELMDQTIQNPPTGMSEDLGKVITSDMKPSLDILFEGIEK